MAKRRKEKKGKAKSLIVLLIFIIIAGGAFLGYRILKDRENEETSSGDGIIFNSKKEEKQVQIFKGDERPIAVMIDNHNGAWPQAGLQKAYMIYEIIVEGGETLLLVGRLHSGSGFNDSGDEKRLVNIDAATSLINNFHRQ